MMTTIQKTALMLFVFALLLFVLNDEHNTTTKEPQVYRNIVAFGDSLTFGFGASASQSYPAYLSQLLGVEVVNAGINGELSGEGLERLPSLLEQYRPDLLIICHGGNDILQKRSLKQLQHNLEQMVMLAQDASSEVLLVAVPNLSLFGLDALALYEQVAIRHALAFEGEILMQVLRDEHLKSDYVHPNAQGYAAIARALYVTLKKAALED